MLWLMHTSACTDVVAEAITKASFHLKTAEPWKEEQQIRQEKKDAHKKEKQSNSVDEKKNHKKRQRNREIKRREKKTRLEQEQQSRVRCVSGEEHIESTRLQTMPFKDD